MRNSMLKKYQVCIGLLHFGVLKCDFCSSVYFAYWSILCNLCNLLIIVYLVAWNKGNFSNFAGWLAQIMLLETSFLYLIQRSKCSGSQTSNSDLVLLRLIFLSPLYMLPTWYVLNWMVGNSMFKETTVLYLFLIFS